MSGIERSTGERIREYEIIELLGKGGMGAVYRARHLYLNTERAIKFIRPTFEGPAKFLDRFIREARILSELSHPNLVQLYEFGESEPGVFYMVMELIIGESVRTRIENKGKISIQESIRIIRQAASALECAHAKGIVHRDISPDNLMIVKSPDGNESTKVIDFGIAKSILGSQNLTQTDHILGKPQYASPEQLGTLEPGEEIDGRSDIYSLGITFYQMLSGVLPFRSDSPQGYIVKHVMEPPKPVSSHFPPGSFPADLEMIIGKTLAKKREHRHPSMKELIFDLDRIQLAASASTILLEDAPASKNLPPDPAGSVQDEIFESPASTAPKRWPKIRLHWVAMSLIAVGVGAFFYQSMTMTYSPNSIPVPINARPDPGPAPTVSPPEMAPVPVAPPKIEPAPPPVMAEPKVASRIIILHSDPPGAEVMVNGQRAGATPLKLTITGPKPKAVVFRLRGYYSEKRIIDKSSSSPISVQLKRINRSKR